MKILIVEDEALARTRIERMLVSLGFEDLVLFESADAVLAHESDDVYDLALLDINMPGTNGLELGYELRYRYPNMAIIYQSAYEEHALDAFDIGAVGYLVKPYGVEQLKATIERVETKEVNKEDFRLLTKNGEHFYLLKPEEIFYVQADLAETIIRTQKGFSYSAKKISDLEKMLEGYNFFKVHRSYIINIDKIKEMQTIEQSKIRFFFEGISDEVESSKDGAKAFRHHFS